MTSTKLVKNAASGRLLVLGAALVPLTLGFLSACGGGSDLACGAGTVQQGDQCVAKSAVTGAGGKGGETDAGSDSAPDAAVEAGGNGGTGGTNAGNGGSAASDAGKPVDEVDFSGITSASPANSTPPARADAGTVVEPDGIKVTWNLAHYAKDPAALIRYEIQVGVKPGEVASGAGAIQAPPGSTSFTVEGLEAGKKHYFRVHAIVDGHPDALDKNASKELSATPVFDDKAPTFQGASSASPAGPKSVTVKWNKPADDPGGTAAAGMVYRAYWATDPNGLLQLGAVSAPGASEVVVNGLPAVDSTFYFRVLAVDAAGNTDANNVKIQGRTGFDSLPPVFGGCVSATDASATEATITWAPAFDDTTTADFITYKVYASSVTISRETAFSSLQVVGTFTGGTHGRVTGLLAASDYRFICHALDSSANEDDNRVITSVKTKTDGTPPTFAGATKAEPDQNLIQINLTWPQAKDTQSADGAIIYNIYGATTQGGQAFGKLPLAKVTGGVTGTNITKDMLTAIQVAEGKTGHPSNTTFYFVVRAEDETGNVEKNLTEVSATTLVSFADDVQPIFSGHCAIQACHTVGVDGTNSPIQGQRLDPGYAYVNVINVPAREFPSVNRVDHGHPDGTILIDSKDPMNSYVFRKITGTGNFTGSTMPPEVANAPLVDAEKKTIEDWIRQGSPDN